MNELKFFKENHYLPYPKTMQLEVTTACPLRCPQCFIDEFNSAYMQWHDFKNIIDEAQEIGVKGVVLFGGEPMVHPNIFSFIEYAIEKQLVIFFYTSGWGLNEEMVGRIKRYGKSFVLFLSLNGATKKTHELSRDRYDVTIDAIKILSENDVDYGINWVSRHDNVNELPELISLAKQYKAKFVNVVSNKISADYLVGQPLTGTDYISVLEQVKRNTGFLVVENCNEMLSNLLLDEYKNIFSGCNAGITNCSITVDMCFVPCLRLLHKERFNTIMDYWTQSETLAQLRKKGQQVSINCSGCKFEGRCNYCRASSKETYNNFHAGIKPCTIKEMSTCNIEPRLAI